MRTTKPKSKTLAIDTIKFYDTQADDYISRTLDLDLSDLYREFLNLLQPGGHILDAGCGPGRDSLYFIQHGFTVTAFDASRAMVDFASQLIGQPVLHLKFSEIEFNNQFDGVWACASLLHVPKSSIDDVIERIIRSLKNKGIFYSSFKYGEDEIFRNGRLFSNYTETTFSELIGKHPKLKIIKMWQTVDVRKDRPNEYWLNAICEKMSDHH